MRRALIEAGPWSNETGPIRNGLGGSYGLFCPPLPTLHVVIPAYNEAETLPTCLTRVWGAVMPAGWDRRVIVVDDASTDDTERILTRFREDGPLEVQRHGRNLGKGAAIRTGFELALARSRDDDAVIVQDADLEYDPADFAALLTPIVEGRSRVVFGTRFGPHHRLHTWGERVHAWGNGLLTRLSNRFSGYDLSDMECGYKVFAAGVVRRMRPMLREDRFGIEPEMTAVLSRLREPIVEVAVSYAPRSSAQGKKIKWRDGVRAVWVMVREAARDADEEAGHG